MEEADASEELPTILIVDDEPGLRQMLSVLFRRAGWKPELAGGVRDALDHIGSAPAYDVVLTDLMMPDGTGITVLEHCVARDPTTQVVMMTAYATTEDTVEAMRKGAYDYVNKPFVNEALLATVEKAAEKGRILRENRFLRARVGRDLVGISPAMSELRAMIARVARSSSSVLVTGESGTGKELVARALHDRSPRAERSFVVVNCGALPANLMESELFGHERGAFTGADRKKAGLFQAADGGTLFLDEIGELPLDVQVKLLRALQERAIRPVGGDQELPVDVRVIAATNRDLEAEVRSGAFREDLFYRLNVIRLEVPPLRERRADILPLADHLLTKHATQQGRFVRFTEEARTWLQEQTFPGNVRELENTIERGVVMASDTEITPEDLDPGRRRAAVSPVGPLPIEDEDGHIDLDAYLASVERAIILRAIEQTDGNRTAAARRLGITFRSLRYRLAKSGED